jgi:hypothetical protein
MKRLFIFIIAAICCSAAFGQNKKVIAVYVTGNCSEDIIKVAGARIIAQIVRSKDYAAVERTADFLAELKREQYYQQSGKVDDGQIIRLGKQFGASLVCVADASKSGGYYLFTTRLVNIETGLIISFSTKYYDPHSIKGYDFVSLKERDIVEIADNLTTELLQNVTTTAGKKKLAVYVTRSSGVFEGKTASSRLLQNFINSGVYAAVDRTSDFQKEIGYQHSGKVEDRQLTKLGRQLGLNLICIVDVLGTGYTDVRMVDVETGIIVATAQANYWRMDDIDKITGELLSQTVGDVCVKKDEKITASYMKCCEGLTEVNGICVDMQGNSIYWFKEETGVEIYNKDIYIQGTEIIKNPDAVCPAGWRLPTKEEFERILTVKDQLKIVTGYLYTTYPQTVSVNGHTYTTVWEWGNVGGFKEYGIYKDGKKYKAKKGEPYSVSFHDLAKYTVYARCVRD